MGSLLRLLTLQVVSPVLRPLIRLLVGFIAVPIFRLFIHKVVRIERLSAETEPTIEVVPLRYVGSDPLATLIRQLYEQVLQPRRWCQRRSGQSVLE